MATFSLSGWGRRKEAASWISPVLFQILEIWGIEDGFQASDHL